MPLDNKDSGCHVELALEGTLVTHSDPEQVVGFHLLALKVNHWMLRSRLVLDPHQFLCKFDLVGL
jgi:hypothetical protein